eukprot:4924934-Pyramimonas_sp.AAC.1
MIPITDGAAEAKAGQRDEADPRTLKRITAETPEANGNPVDVGRLSDTLQDVAGESNEPSAIRGSWELGKLWIPLQTY